MERSFLRETQAGASGTLQSTNTCMESPPAAELPAFDWSVFVCGQFKKEWKGAISHSEEQRELIKPRRCNAENGYWKCVGWRTRAR